MYFVAIKMGRRQGGPSRTGGGSGAYLNRYVTDEQRGRRPIFIATKYMLFRGQDTRLVQEPAIPRPRSQRTQGLAEFGTPIPDELEIRVHDSNAKQALPYPAESAAGC